MSLYTRFVEEFNFFKNYIEMKIKLLLLCFFSFTMTYSNAQIALAADTLTTQVTADFDIVGHNSFTNQLPQLKTFKWTRNVVEITDGWLSAICDENQCYTTGVDSKEIDLGPQATSRLDVHIYPTEPYQGYAFVEMLVEDASNANTNITAYYVFDSELSTSTRDLQPINFKIYPNPTNGLFKIENSDAKVAALKVYNTTGKQLKHFVVGQRQWYDLANLVPGTYLVQLLDGEGITLGSKMITKF